MAKPSVHCIGIGGIGLSSLARWFLAQNWLVTGSDLFNSPITQELKKRGVKVEIGHKRSNIPPKAGLVIYSQAIKQTNTELREARRRKLKVLSYPQMLGRLTRHYPVVIAVAGAHGKSTTTALIALILELGGFDPTVILGTKIKEFSGSNFHPGRSQYLLIEADEYGRAFLHYSPTLALVTNIDREHLDTYKNLNGVKTAFLKFLSQVRAGGITVLNADDFNLFVLKKRIESIARKNKLEVHWCSLHSSEAKKIKKYIRIPGQHNLSNALAAYSVAKALGINEKTIFEAIFRYQGSWRRMEYRGTFHVPRSTLHVYDDYAHHPTEIKATLAAFREKFPKQRIVCVFQPHQAERLRRLFKEFQTAFDLADITLILPVYQVAGRDKVNPKFDSTALVRAIQRQQPEKLIFYLPDPKKIKPAIITLLNPTLKPSASGGSASGGKSYKLKAILIMMGAGDIADHTKDLLLFR